MFQGDFTRTGERKLAGVMKDGVNSANRYYLNRFRDAYRQAVIGTETQHVCRAAAAHVRDGRPWQPACLSPPPQTWWWACRWRRTSTPSSVRRRSTKRRRRRARGEPRSRSASCCRPTCSCCCPTMRSFTEVGPSSIATWGLWFGVLSDFVGSNLSETVKKYFKCL